MYQDSLVFLNSLPIPYVCRGFFVCMRMVIISYLLIYGFWTVYQCAWLERAFIQGLVKKTNEFKGHEIKPNPNSLCEQKPDRFEAPNWSNIYPKSDSQKCWIFLPNVYCRFVNGPLVIDPCHPLWQSHRRHVRRLCLGRGAPGVPLVLSQLNHPPASCPFLSKLIFVGEQFGLYTPFFFLTYWGKANHLQPRYLSISWMIHGIFYLNFPQFSPDLVSAIVDFFD